MIVLKSTLVTLRLPVVYYRLLLLRLTKSITLRLKSSVVIYSIT